MSTTTTAPVVPSTPATRPSALRRTALVAAGVPACALPVVWGAGTVTELVTGAERDHLFHQLTGQGLLLSALWLGGLVPLLVAGWRGVRPSAGAAALHVAVVASAAVAALQAPGNGAALVAAVAAVTGALVWTALPRRPRLLPAGLDPLLAPVALAGAALLVPFVIGQAAEQRAMADEHAAFTHYFDMAWIAGALVLALVLAAGLPAARRVALPVLAATAYLGLTRLLVVGETGWSLTAVGLGVAGTAAVLVADRAARRRA